MLPDIDGHQRLEGNLTEIPQIKKAGEKKAGEKKADDKPPPILTLAKSWDDLRERFLDFYRPVAGKHEGKNPEDREKLKELQKLHEQLAEEAQKVYQRHVQGLNEFVEENGKKIKAHFQSLKRYEEGLKTDPRTMFQTQRRWEEMQDLRKEAKAWIADLDSRENAFKGELRDLLSTDCKAEVEAVRLDEKAEAAAVLGERKKAAEAEAKKRCRGRDEEA